MDKFMHTHLPLNFIKPLLLGTIDLFCVKITIFELLIATLQSAPACGCRVQCMCHMRWWVACDCVNSVMSFNV